MTSKLSNQDLLQRFGKLVRTERKVTHLILEAIAEIDRRKIYLEMAYPSLFEFLMKEHGYSESAAVRRIDAARLLRQVPEMAQKIESGLLNLSQLSQVQKSLRQVRATTGHSVSPNQTRELLNKIQGKSSQSSQVILAQELGVNPVITASPKMHADESVTLSLTFSKDQMQILRAVQDQVSHAVPLKDWAQLFLYLSKRQLAQQSLKEAKTKTLSRVQAESENNNRALALNKVPVPLPNQHSAPPKTVTPKTRMTLLHPSAACCFRHHGSGKVCGSRRFLQIDHVQPQWAKGSHRPENLQVLCAAHNRWKYRTEAGIQEPHRKLDTAELQPKVDSQRLQHSPSVMGDILSLGGE